MYKTPDEILENLRSKKTSINSVNRQMLRWFNKGNVAKWLMFAEAKVRFLMETKQQYDSD